MVTVVGVRFKKAGKVYYFSPGDIKIKKTMKLSSKQQEVLSLVML